MKSNTRVWGIALIVSLMFNAFALGLLLSDRFAHRPFLDRAPPAAARFSGPDQSPESQHVRELFQELRKSKRKDFLPFLRAIRSARAQVQEALLTEPFDPAALDSALAAVRIAEQAAAKHAHQTISQLATQLGPDERADLGRMIRHHRGGPSERMMPGGGAPPPPSRGPETGQPAD